MHAFDEVFNIQFDGIAAKEFEQTVVAKMKSFYKSFDTDKYWAAACYNDRFMKSAQVKQTVHKLKLFMTFF